MRPVFILILGLALAVNAQDLADHATVAERSQLADGLYAREMYTLAATEYAALLADKPDAAEADVMTFRLGECHRHTGNIVEADKAFRRVFVEFPKSKFRFRAGFRRANLFKDAGKPAAAVPLYEMLLGASPPPDIEAPARFYRGDAQLELGKIDEARKAFQEVQKRFPDSPFYVYALLKLGSLQDVRESEAQRRSALALYGEVLAKAKTGRVTAEALFQLAELHYALGEYEKSAGMYARLLAEHPKDQRTSGARLRAAWSAHNAGLYADALKTAEASMEIADKASLPDWLYLKANCERQLVRNETAIATYDKLLALEPKAGVATAARYEKAVTYYRMGRFADAVTEARAVKLSDANRRDVHWLLAESHAALEAHDDAIQYYRLIVRDFPDNAVAGDALYRLAYQLQDRGDFKEASQYYRQLAETFPTNRLAPQALFASGYCLVEAKLDGDAVSDWAGLVARYPADTRVGEALYRKGLAEIRLERSDDALGSLGTLLKRFPNSSFAADAHYWRGMLLREAGKAHDAESELRKALDAKPRAELARESEFVLGVVLHQQDKHEEAARRLQPLIESPVRGKFTPDLLQWLAEYQYNGKRYSEAQLAAQRLVEGGDGARRQIGWGLLGRCHLARGDKAEAARAFESGLKQKARTAFAAESALRLGEIRLEEEDFVASANYFHRAASMASDESTLGIRAHAYFGLGLSTKAQEDLDRAARYFMSVAILYDDPDIVPQCLYEASTIFGKLGKTNEQQKTAGELVKRYPESEWAKRKLVASGATQPE